MFKKIVKIFNYNKEKYENILDSNSKIWTFLSKFITFLIILFAIVLSFETLWNNEIVFHFELMIFEAFISTIFAIEYFYRLFKSKNKIKFLFSPIRIIDLLSFLPFFLGFITIWDFLKVLRLLRILRIMKLIKDIPLTAWFVKSLKDYKEEYRAVFILFLIILFISSSYVYFLEKDFIGTKFTSIPMALWWGLITMSTVGYWDMIPTSDFWKIIAAFLVFVWPLILALASAITVMVFMDTSKKNEIIWHSRRWKKCTRCHEKNPKNANYCMKCGEIL